MNKKRILISILIGFIIVMITIGIVINKSGIFEEHYIEDDASIEKQLDHLYNLQVKADNIVMNDDNVQELIERKNHLKTLEIIHNESHVEEYYWIGFEYENLSEYKGLKMTGGKIYRFFIDLNNKKVLSVEELKNQGLREKQTTDEEFFKDKFTSIHSLASIETINGWSSLHQRWEYYFSVNGTGEIRLTPDPPKKAKGWGCFQHQLTIKEIYNKENYYFHHVMNDPDSKIVWCSSDKLPQIKSVYSNDDLICIASYPPENSVWNIINPGNWPSDAGFFYDWYVKIKQNQTIVFDVNVKFENIEKGRNTDETNHFWRVIITSPTDPRKLSVEQMKEYGIYGHEDSWLVWTYFHNSGIILVKQEYINAIPEE